MNEEVKAGAVVADNVLALVGNTPIVRLNRLPPAGSAEILAKLELYSPGGSIKDRLALHIMDKGEEEGLIGPDTIIVEPTSGNTGIGLAMVCAARRHRCILVMPDSMSLERQIILKRFGAEVVLTPNKAGMEGAVRKATDLTNQLKNAFCPRQFESLWNADIHRRTTAREILLATGARIDAFVAGVGTGGTITGVGEVLKQEIPGIRIIAVEPAGSPVLSTGRAGHHKIQGIGAGFVPKVLNRDIIDEVRTVSDDDAFDTMKRLAAAEAILAGLSAGAAVHVTLQVARDLGRDRRVVTILPDTGERYFSVQHYYDL